MRIRPQREAGASSSTDGEDKSRHTSTKTENNNHVFLCLFGEGEGGCVAGVARRRPASPGVIVIVTATISSAG